MPSLLYDLFGGESGCGGNLFDKHIQCYWTITEDISSKLADTFALTNKWVYPAIHTILTVLIKMPASTVPAESSFSALKIIKNY